MRSNCRGKLQTVLAGCVALIVSVFGGAARVSGANPAVAAAPGQTPGAIPLPEVAARSAETQSLLPTLALPLTPTVDLQHVIDQVPAADEQISTELDELQELLQEPPSLGTLAAQRQVWADRQLETSQWLSLLTDWMAKLDASLDRLKILDATWRQTETSATANGAPPEILALIRTVQAAIKTTRAPFEAERKLALSLQGQVAHLLARCETALQMLTHAQHQAVGGLLVREAPPIWASQLWHQSGAAFVAALRETTANRWQTVGKSLRVPVRSLRLPISVIALLLFLYIARCQARSTLAASAESRAAAQVCESPIAATCVVLLAYISSPSTQAVAPPGVRQLFIALGLLPAIHLVRPRLSARWVRRLYVATAVFALDGIRQGLVGVPGLEQALLAFEVLVVLVILWRAFRAGALGAAVAQAGPATRVHLRLWAIIVLSALAAGLVSGAFGYLRLARLIMSAVLGSGAWALTLYAGTGVVLGLIAIALEMWPLQRLRMVQRHREVLIRRTRVLLGWLAVGVWAWRTVDYIGLYQPVQGAVQRLLTAKVEWGAISLSLGDVLVFAFTVYVAYALSKFVRFALAEDVYPLMPVSPGVTYAFSTLLHYAIIAIGCLIAVGALGVDLTKVTIVAGALGVGIGLGLQGIVNNCVSGLILLFEQAVQVGDTVEVEGVAGQVTRIGIRASIVRTWQGADVVVPNTLLVAQRLTNWTLSDRRRRIDIPIAIKYGTPPDKVITLLKTVAAGHPGILTDPAPEAAFIGFGENAVNYELRLWAMQDAAWQQTRNDVASIIYATVQNAGMAFARPQRDVRVISQVPMPVTSESAGPTE